MQDAPAFLGSQPLRSIWLQSIAPAEACVTPHAALINVRHLSRIGGDFGRTTARYPSAVGAQRASANAGRLIVSAASPLEGPSREVMPPMAKGGWSKSLLACQMCDI